MNASGSDEVDRRSAEVVASMRRTLARGNDRLFAGLLLVQWLVGIAAALVFSTPARPWVGWAVLAGLLIVVPPVVLAWNRPGSRLTRQAIAVAQMSIGALLVHLRGGEVAAHFHLFGSLALLAFYRDWRVLATASAVAVVAQLILQLVWPMTLPVPAGTPAEFWRWVELAAWVGFIDVFLIRSCVLADRQTKEIAQRQVELELAREKVEQTIREQTASLKVATLIEIMGQSTTVEEAATVALEMVRASFGWQFAVYRTVDPADATLRYLLGSGADIEEIEAEMASSRLRIGEGIGGLAWESSDLVVIPDLQRQRRGIPSVVARADLGWSGAAFPILIGEQVVATMEFFAPAPVNETVEERKALREVARIVSQTIERIRNVERQRTSAVESAAFHAVLEAVGRAQSVAEAAGLALDAVRHAYSWRYGIFWSRESSSSEGRFSVGSGKIEGDFRRASIASPPREGEGWSVGPGNRSTW